MSTGRDAKSDYVAWIRMLHGKVNGTEDPSEARKVELAKDRIAFRPPPISLVETYYDVLVDDDENGNKTMKGGAVRCCMVHIAGTCDDFGAVKYTRN